MAALSQSDLDQVSRLLRGLYRTRRVQPLIWYVLRELPSLVGSNQVTWNRVVPLLGEADVMAWPAQSQHAELQSALARNLNQHPLIVNFLETGDPSALKISDFLSKRAFHNSALYDELYRHLKYEDQFAMNLSPLGPVWTTLVVARDRCNFRERDRTVLDLLRPHIAQAYRNAKAFERLTRSWESQRSAPSQSRIVVDRGDEIVNYPARAQRWLSTYFSELPNSPLQLPREVQAWLDHLRSVQTGGLIKASAAPLCVRRGDRELLVRLALNDEARGATLLLEERTAIDWRQHKADWHLTPRELQVLCEVEKGKHNREIAVTLGIQIATVKKHLEHVFDKLGVDNRTAAVACLRAEVGEHRQSNGDG